MLPHMEQVRELAAQVSTAAEFGVRNGASTCALLCGLDDGNGTALASYDIAPARYDPAETRCAWTFTQADTSKLEPIAPTDLLFIDTLHTAEQVTAELKHAPHVRRFLVFHDVIAFGSKGESNGEGINPAIYDFLADNWNEWHVKAHHRSTWGLLVLERHASTS